jgi:hypothetical protein
MEGRHKNAPGDERMGRMPEINVLKLCLDTSNRGLNPPIRQEESHITKMFVARVVRRPGYMEGPIAEILRPLGITVHANVKPW